jgi:hypothetical protein
MLFNHFILSLAVIGGARGVQDFPLRKLSPGQSSCNCALIDTKGPLCQGGSLNGQSCSHIQPYSTGACDTLSALPNAPCGAGVPDANTCPLATGTCIGGTGTPFPTALLASTAALPNTVGCVRNGGTRISTVASLTVPAGSGYSATSKPTVNLFSRRNPTSEAVNTALNPATIGAASTIVTAGALSIGPSTGWTAQGSGYTEAPFVIVLPYRLVWTAIAQVAATTEYIVTVPTTTIVKGDIVTITGATGTGAALYNKQHTVITSTTTLSTGSRSQRIRRTLST